MKEVPMILRDLQPGDRFICLKDRKKYPTKYTVIDKPVFNARHGRPTRSCFNETSKQQVSKSCGVAVKKLEAQVEKQ